MSCASRKSVFFRLTDEYGAWIVGMGLAIFFALIMVALCPAVSLHGTLYLVRSLSLQHNIASALRLPVFVCVRVRPNAKWQIYCCF